jgi:hypothetical protein
MIYVKKLPASEADIWKRRRQLCWDAVIYMPVLNL